MGHGLHRVVLGSVDQRLEDGPVLAVGLLAPAAQFVEEGRLTRQCVADLLDDAAEDGVAGRLGHRQVEDGVHGDPRGGVGLLLHPVEQMAQMVEVLRGAAQRGVPGDRDLDMPAHFQQVAGGVVAEGGVLDRVRQDERPLAALGDGQAHGLQGPEGFPQHGAADLEGPAQLGFGGELVAHGVVTALDGAAQVAEDRFHRADAPREGASCLAV